ncbi:dNTP-hexose glycosyl transferase [Lentzea sp. NBRC 105346]|uniref:glycosyltransferase n=1 Tax=Lentzea sp. NBRC 105346 TaxID=3032205 RepID=UPI0024A5ADED|nr:glycosyltransferase [Lentzea sp. NBRC 105346]GLZ29310.1 dNTP-hexose glycosyl transferase [Lentzea sp. NBRC 105346]
MRILFVTGGSPATVFPLTPLATAARNAGHQVFVASTEETMPAVAGAGLPGVSVSPTPIRTYITTDRSGAPIQEPTDPLEHMHYIGHGFGRLAAGQLPGLFELAQAWRPDVVVGGFLVFAAPVLAARLGVPYVRHSWDSGEPPVVDVAAEQEMRPELENLGLSGIPAADLWIDICPPSVRPPDAPAAQPMRYIPCNMQQTLEPWMYTKANDRRILVTAGTKVAIDNFFDYLVNLVDKVKPLDAEIVVAAPDRVSAQLTERLGVRAGWLPLDVVTPSCDLLVHHAGGGTALTGMACAVPQLLIPNMPKLIGPSERLAAYGAAKMLREGEDTPDAIAAACEELLTTPSYAQRSVDISQEIAAMPSPAEVLSVVEKLA